MDDDDEADLVLRITRFTPGVPANDAEDVGQERAYRYYRYARCTDRSAVRRALYADAPHAAIRYAETYRKSRHRVTLVGLDGYDAPLGEDPADAVVREEAARALWRLVRRLPGKQPYAVWLDAHGASGAEIALALGISEQAARALLYRARRTLRRLVSLAVAAFVLATLLVGRAVGVGGVPAVTPAVPREQPSTLGLHLGDHGAVGRCHAATRRPSRGEVPPGATATVAAPEMTMNGWSLPVVLRGPLTVVSVHVAVVSADGRHILNDTSDRDLRPFGKPVTVGAGRDARFEEPLQLWPCLDSFGGPVALRGPLLARVLVLWRDGFGAEHVWRLPDRTVAIVPEPARTLPLLHADDCVEMNGRTYFGVVSGAMHPFLRVDLRPEIVTAEGGAATLTFLLTNHTGRRLALANEGGVVRPTREPSRYVLAPDETVAQPVSLPMVSCPGRRPLPPGTHVVLDDSNTRGLAGSTTGALVVVP